jgi:hypothetical protein
MKAAGFEAVEVRSGYNGNDLNAYVDPEIVWRLEKPNHAGLIVRSPTVARVNELLASYSERFKQDFMATLPAALTPFD